MLLLLMIHIAISLVLLPVAVAKRGASTNYLLPLILTLSPLAGIVVWRVFAAARNSRQSDFVLLGSFSLILLVCQPMLSAAPRILSRGDEGDKEQYAAERRALIAAVRSTPGTIYSEDILLLLQAGKSVFAEPSIITNLAATARWDEHPFLGMLARKAFPLILAKDLNDHALYSPAVVRLIRANYEKGEQLDGLVVYRPRP
jgi:hypothetical protein